MILSSPSIKAIAACGALAVCSAAGAAAPSVADASGNCCRIVELRQYITYPGKRDVLATLFEREFIEPQEAAGIRVLAQFRDLNDPYRFTWLRGFASMEARKQSLGDFYFGPLWKKYRNEANATLYDNDDVLLLRPASNGAGFATAGRERDSGKPAGLIVATLYHFGQEVAPAFIAQFDRQLSPLFERHGAQTLGRFVSDNSVNTFAQLPVRENAHVYAWFARFDDRAAYDRYLGALAEDTEWREHFAPLYKSLARPPETLMLSPTARSLLR